MMKKLEIWEYVPQTSEDRYDALYTKYQKFLSEPNNVLPDLVDTMFKDFNLNYSFKDVKKIATGKKDGRTQASLRTKVLARDNHRCVICGATAETARLHVDHIVARDRGGLTEERNLRTLCESCNWGKTNKPFSVTG